MTNCHTTWHSMRIYNNIRSYSIRSTRHITFTHNNTNCSFLSCSRTKFVSNLRNPFAPNSNFCYSFTFFSFCHKCFIHYTNLSFFCIYRIINISIYICNTICAHTYNYRFLCNNCVFFDNT